ncbi:hypothetical protein [Sinorhizobium mexicanum]|uniref:Uncharacterized protein n=1 Tax=Sinorhizobium mexicanum TaxID=375549 RepID=A0A859QHU2_9HYPH|nr:hypothetical protein [Sinorhizobium mexicanum]MBP1887409.1 hypothetical protein [Sinorhizobium mexicanum]QLL62305.1 hypothetical protein FKV68_13100 [Sinorhizobium mexicanum]
MRWLFTLASVTLAFSSPSLAAELTAEVPKGDPEFIAKAMSAAPADIGMNATIIRIGEGFKVTPIRTGTNMWTCAVDMSGEPWCADAVGLEWFRAISTQAEPPDKTGFIYMFAGDLGTSNHDPYATDKSHWIRTGPHVMIVGKAAHEMAANYPHEVDANPAHAYVMFPGTKYQHLMLPADMGTGHGQ